MEFHLIQVVIPSCSRIQSGTRIISSKDDLLFNVPGILMCFPMLSCYVFQL